ncbi:MAG TPA: nucleotide-binding protein [Polyangiaceae bacterium]|nr:nucleotide-binding protein [Polyangiaceae bacterium]
MKWLANQYVAANFPNHKVWNFSPPANDKVFPELKALALVEQMGTRGSPFRLTNMGHQWVMANREMASAAEQPAEELAAPREADPGLNVPKMFNLIVTAASEAWSKPTYVLDLSRYLEHTEDNLRKRLKELNEKSIAVLTKLPTLFAYETHVDAPARIGWIADIQVRDQEVRITPRFDEALKPIPPEMIESRKWELRIGDWEMSRTHWAVKGVDLFDALRGRQDDDPIVPPYAASPAPATGYRALGDKVFIVHGRDNGAKHEVARFLEQIGVEPVILHERPNGGRTLINKFQEEAAGIHYAVVLMTPDDIGGLVGASQSARARQNVIFELGFFIGKLGAAKVCALMSGDIEKPSDFDAVVYIQYGPSTGWKTELARELRHAGVTFDANRIF